MVFLPPGIFIVANLALVAGLLSSIQCCKASEFSSLFCELLGMKASHPIWYNISSDFAWVWSSMAQDLCLQEKWGASSSTSDMPLSSETSDSTLLCCGVPNLSSNVSDKTWNVDIPQWGEDKHGPTNTLTPWHHLLSLQSCTWFSPTDTWNSKKNLARRPQIS